MKSNMIQLCSFRIHITGKKSEGQLTRWTAIIKRESYWGGLNIDESVRTKAVW